MARPTMFARSVAIGIFLGGSLLTACGGGGTTEPTTCSPTGTALQITAPRSVFDKSCLATLPNRSFTVAFTNQESGVSHNFLISTAFAPTSPILFQGDAITGPASTTYDIGPLPTGTYSFECSLHPAFMHGTFVVAAETSSSGSTTSTS